MGAAGVELPEWITESTVERAHARANLDSRLGRRNLAQAGMRAARARDSALLKALEGGAEILQRMNDRQLGPHFRVGSIRVDATEVQLWREAYRLADEGEPIEQMAYIYGAAALLAGLAS